MTEQTVLIDIDVMEWKVAETRAFRKAVGVNPEYALGVLANAARDSAEEARARFGDAEPPADYMPLELLNIDPAYLLGFAWIKARREEPALTLDEMGERLGAGALMQGFFAMVAGEDEDPLPEQPAPDPEQLTMRRSSSKTASGSAAATAGDSETLAS